MKLLNRSLGAGERIEYMGWVHEGVVCGGAPWQSYAPRFLVLRGTDVMLFHTPPATLADLAKCPEVLKVYQTMFRTVKESETVDWRQHCFLVAAGAPAPAPAPAHLAPRYSVRCSVQCTVYGSAGRVHWARCTVRAWLCAGTSARRRGRSCCAWRRPGPTTSSTPSSGSGRRRSRWCTAGARRGSRWTGRGGSPSARARPARRPSGHTDFRSCEVPATTASRS
ncbi:unnamed protein product [Diatraea saccharalis]|uniref:Uncharacterized protein n=1 Tax=Diatraea saccharalis TaxID=40085 RepID=A0A9N9RGN0_9NEOP|nr:unnamed protein product [Diatraea saccharalis]